MSGGIHDGRVAIAEKWSFLVRVYGQRDEHRQKEANTKKNGTLLFVTVFWARDKVRNTPALVRFTTRNRTAPPPRPPYHSPSENQYSAKVLVKRLWVGTLSRVIKVYQECI